MGGEAEGDDVMAEAVATETASAVAAVVGLLNCWRRRERRERGEILVSC